MQSAETYLGLVRERGKAHAPLERVYRQLFNPAFYQLAYNGLCQRKYLSARGIERPERWTAIIDALRYERYHWSPQMVRSAAKTQGTASVTLVPSWSDKIVQEAIRLILDAYYEPRFSRWSHAFRPGKGCHTALKDVYQTWAGTVWFIEVDLQICFAMLDSTILLTRLAQDIHDTRFLNLVKEMLQAGYLADWKYRKTLSGVPSGGIISPLLSNIYLSLLDTFVEETLIPTYTKGKKRKANPAYTSLSYKLKKHRLQGQYDEANAVLRELQQLPCQAPNDAAYRRLRYVRYGNAFLLGYVGSRKEAEEIEQRVFCFLKDTLNLKVAQGASKILHAKTEAARFLGYEISTYQRDDARDKLGRRVLNGKIEIALPDTIIQEMCQRYMAKGKPKALKERTHDSVFSIVARYQTEFRGIADYYKLAHNCSKLTTLKWVMEVSLVKTLATKLRITVPKVYKRYKAVLWIGKQQYKGLQVALERGEDKKPFVAQWGGISLKRELDAVLDDRPHRVWNTINDLEKRLFADVCENCGSTQEVEVHHVRALKDLKQSNGVEKPMWVKKMAALQRKTRVLCRKCHVDVHAGCLQKQRHERE